MNIKAKVPFEEFKVAVSERLQIEKSLIKKEASWTTDIGISSIDLVKIVMLVRQKFGVKIPTTTIGKVRTVQETFELVNGESI